MSRTTAGKRLKFIVECLDGARIPLNAEQRGEVPGNYLYWGANGVVDHVGEWIFDEELILLGEDGAPFFDKKKDVAFLINGKVWINNHIHVLRAVNDAFLPKFVVYALNAADYIPFVDGATRDKLTQEKMGDIPIPVFSIDDQKGIVTFLDNETEKIDALIAEKERLLGLLTEKRRTVIADFLTKGLNKDTPRSDSDIPWLGEIPAHWKIERAKWLFTERDDRSDSGDEELLTVSHLTGVTSRAEKDVNMFMAESLEGYKRCEAGDLVINTLWAWMGAMGIAHQPGIVSPAYNVYKPVTELDPEYIDLLVRTPRFVEEITRYSKGVWSSRLRLYPEGLYEAWLPVPPLDEQQAIVKRVQIETQKLDALAGAAHRTIALLQERRSALISATVTGQLEISTPKEAPCE